MEGGSGPVRTAAQSERTENDAGAVSTKRGRNRTGLWKAIAGMAAALALASAIVSMDISRELIHRTHYMSHRIATLHKDVRKLELEAEANRARLAAARKALSERGLILRVLVAPDVVSFKLVPSAPGTKTTATLRISREMSGAVLNATGLEKLAPGHAYEAWWVSKGAPPAKAAEFLPQADGSATIYLGAPPQKTRGLECLIIRGNAGKDSAKEPGSVLLGVRLGR